MKTIKYVFTVVLLLCGYCAANAEIITGNCGVRPGTGSPSDNLQYKLDTETGLLEIYGKGAMASYSHTTYDGDAQSGPFYKVRSLIKEVVVYEGVTSIGSNIFYNSSIEKITIPSSVTSFGSSIFSDCRSLKEVNLGGASGVDSDAFSTLTTDDEDVCGIFNNGIITIPSCAYKIYEVDGLFTTQFVKWSWPGRGSKKQTIPFKIVGCTISKANFDFTKPYSLYPAIEPSEDEGAGVNLKDESFIDNDVKLQFGLGDRTQAYSVREWTNEDRTCILRAYHGATITISVPEHKHITGIEINGVDTEDMSVNTGIYYNGMWGGNEQSVTFTITNATNIKISDINITYTSDDIHMTDGMDFYQSVNADFKYYTYTRNFTNTNWQALYIPFSLSYDEWKDEFDVAKINNVHMYDRDNDGVVEDMELEVVKVTSGTLKPNNPYLIRAKEIGEKIITKNDAMLYATENNSISCASTEMKFNFTGTYDAISQNTLEGMDARFLSGGRLVKPGSNLGSFRWYMTIENLGGQVISDAAMSKMNVVCINDDDITEVKVVGLDNDAMPVLYIGIDGKQSTIPRKGLNIVRYSDGTVRKITF